MARNELLKQFDIEGEELEKQVSQIAGDLSDDRIQKVYQKSVQDFTEDTILKGRVIEVTDDEVVVDVGFKAEGIVPRDHFDPENLPKPGDEVEVLLEGIDDDSGLILLSHKKAQRIRCWERIISTCKEGDVVKGINKQIENLERYGLIEDKGRMWKWKV